MRFFMVICVAAVLFLSGIITGFHYSQVHLKEMQSYPLATIEEEEPEQEPAFRPQDNKEDLSHDLLKRQSQMKKEGTINMFSNLGETLDIFGSSS